MTFVGFVNCKCEKFLLQLLTEDFYHCTLIFSWPKCSHSIAIETWATRKISQGFILQLSANVYSVLKCCTQMVWQVAKLLPTNSIQGRGDTLHSVLKRDYQQYVHLVVNGIIHVLPTQKTLVIEYVIGMDTRKAFATKLSTCKIIALRLKYVGLVVLFTNPSARAGYDTRSIFKRSLTGLNSEFSFSYTSCLTKAEEPSLSYYLPISGGRIIGFIPFPRVLVLCEMQSVSSRIWTRIAVFISYCDNDYTTW